LLFLDKILHKTGVTKMKIIDLRSDTVTRPSMKMRQAIFDAEVGDDVMGEDPTVNRLEEYAANLLGKEAALFVATGTQGNLLSVLSHCQRGEEYIAGSQSHLFLWEAGGSCVLGGVYPQPLDFESDGTLDLNKVKKLIKPDDSHFAITKLLALENTYGGKVLPLSYLKEASAFATLHHLSTHLDGARLFNAAIASQVPAKEIAKHFDSVTFCLSKGLGAPVGSLICSNKEIIAKARRLRKMVGGGMRQAGILAAAGLFALQNNVDRLLEDHQNAAYLAEGLKQFTQLEGKVRSTTNMVFIDRDPALSAALPVFFESKGIIIWGEDPMRLVTHLDVNKQDIERVLLAFKEFYATSKRSVY
jgi:threonine aldolase